MKKISKLLFSVGMVGMALGLASCGKEEKVKVTLSSEETTEKMERHQSRQFSVELENAEQSDVTYHVTGGATISEIGLLTIKDDAEVGSTITVFATAKEVTSNEIKITVDNTTPTAIDLVASSIALHDGESISFNARFTPSYSTLVEYDLEVTEGAELAEIKEGKLSLKQGISEFEHLGESVKVKATSKANASVSKELVISVGVREVMLSVASKGIDARTATTDDLVIKPSAYDDNGTLINIPQEHFTFASSNQNVFTIGEHDGVITPVGHGTADVTVSYGKESAKATIAVMIAPKGIKVNLSNKAISSGLHYGKSESFKFDLDFDKAKTGAEGEYANVCNNLVYDFTLFDSNNEKVEMSSSDIATYDDNGNITFKVNGKVMVHAKSNSSIGDYECADAAEKEFSQTFFVNDGKNIRTLKDLRTYVPNADVRDINIVQKVDVIDDRTNKDQLYFGSIDSRGDKIFYGNGYEISFENLKFLDDTLSDSANYNSDFIVFYSKEGPEPAVRAGTPYTVQMYDLEFNEYTDFNGNYIGKLADNVGKSAKGGAKSDRAFNRTYRRAFFIGYENYSKDFINDQGVPVVEANAGAYIKDLNLTNVTVRGFQTGIRINHAVDGYIEGLNISNVYNNAVELDQCTIEMHNTTFGQSGGFCTEITPDGISDKLNIKGVRASQGRQAGEGYNEKSSLHMTGYIHSENLNSGTDSDYMNGYNFGGVTITQAIQAIVGGLIQEVLTEKATDIISGGKNIDDATNFLLGLSSEMMFNNNTDKKVNFFTLMFLAETGMDGTSDGQYADWFASFKENNNDMTNIKDVLSDAIKDWINGDQYLGYKSLNYAVLDLDTKGAFPGVPSYLGRVVLVNNAYVAK